MIIFLENDGSENCAQLLEEEVNKMFGTKYLNDERPPFWAFKDKTPPPNESFDQFREKAQNDISIFNKMKQLRAYFWYEIKYLNKHYEEENLIILSHFIIKETAMMTEEDVHICRNQKHKFDMIQGEKYA